MTPARAATGGEPRLVPVSFEAYRLAHAASWLHYAHAHLQSRPSAHAVIDRAFDDLAHTWTHALSRPNVHAHAWALFKQHLGPHPPPFAIATLIRDAVSALARRSPTSDADPGPLRASSSLPARYYDVLVLHVLLRRSEEEVADLLGATADEVRCDLRWALRRPATHPGTIDTSEDTP